MSVAQPAEILPLPVFECSTLRNINTNININIRASVGPAHRSSLASYSPLVVTSCLRWPSPGAHSAFQKQLAKCADTSGSFAKRATPPQKLKPVFKHLNRGVLIPVTAEPQLPSTRVHLLMPRGDRGLPHYLVDAQVLRLFFPSVFLGRVPWRLPSLPSQPSASCLRNEGVVLALRTTTGMSLSACP